MVDASVQKNPCEICRHFQVAGTLVEVFPYGEGHINDTLLGVYQNKAGITRRYIHQRINHNVFKQPEKVMENIERVTRYSREQRSFMIASGCGQGLSDSPETLQNRPRHHEIKPRSDGDL